MRYKALSREIVSDPERQVPGSTTLECAGREGSAHGVPGNGSAHGVPGYATDEAAGIAH